MDVNERSNLDKHANASGYNPAKYQKEVEEALYNKALEGYGQADKKKYKNADQLGSMDAKDIIKYGIASYKKSASVVGEGNASRKRTADESGVDANALRRSKRQNPGKKSA